MKSSEALYAGNDERVLLLLQKSRDAASLLSVLERVGVPAMMCATAEELCLEIAKGVGAVIVDEEMFSRGAKECLSRIVSRFPSWSELPIIVLLRHGSETQQSRDALLLPGEVALVEVPLRTSTLVSLINNALRSRRRQYLVRDQLRALDESYRTLFDSIDEGFCVVEVIFDATGIPLDYRFLSTNRSFEKQTGLSNVQGKGMRELAPEHEESWFQIYGQVALTGEPVRFENHAQQLQKWFDVHAFRTGQPEERQVAIIFYDISDRKRAEFELKLAKEELEVRVRERTEELAQALEKLRAETEDRIRAVDDLHRKNQLLMQQGRMAAIGEMIRFIGHQWRQPLNTMALIVQELSMVHKMGKFDQEYLDKSTATAMQVIKQMSQTIDDFMNFFKPDKEKVFFRIEEIFANTLTLVRSSFRESNVTIEVSVEDDVVTEGYPNEYSQVLLNILMNARDALVERKVRQPRISVRIFRGENNKAVTTIADNAGGVPEESIESVFDAYFTTKGDKGTGIGLYMARMIIEKNMDGTLSVRNVEEGAEFRIET